MCVVTSVALHDYKLSWYVEQNILDTICMEDSGDELGLEEVEIVQNPYYNHAAQFEDFEEIEGKN